MGSHGGAWKVAYADFVTGMMSLFLVLWILSQDEEVIIATTRFFRDPYKAGVPKSTPVEQMMLVREVWLIKLWEDLIPQ